MNIKIEKERIKKILEKIQGLTNQKTSFLVTKNVLIKTEGTNQVSFSATDLTAEYFCKVEAFVEKEGTIAVNAKKLYEIVKNYPDNILSIEETESQWIKIGEKDVVFNLVGVLPDDFPKIENEFNHTFFETNGASFKKLLGIGNSIHPEVNETRSFILGLYIGFFNQDEKSYIRMFSTDTRRLTKFDILTDSVVSEEFNQKNIILPKKILSDLIKFIDEENIKISFTNDIFVIAQENEYFSVNLLEGDFPDCNNLILSDEENAVEIDKYIFSEILTRMSIVTDEKNPIIYFSFSKDLLTVTSSNPELGEAKESTPISFDREEFEVAFNPRFFLDIIKDIPEETIKVYLKNENSQCIIKGFESSDLVSAVMPIKI